MLLLLATLALPATAVADEVRVEVSRGIVKSTSEHVAMGGTGVALGAGGPGLFHNPAATVHRKLETQGDLTIGPGLSLTLISPRGGGSDTANLPPDVWSDLDTGQWRGAMLNAALNAGFRRVGFGWAGSLTAWWREDQRMVVADSQFVAGAVAADGRLKLAGGLRRLDADLEESDGYSSYMGIGPELGFIWHAPRQGVAFGAAWWSAINAKPQAFDGVLPVDAVVAPHRISTGMAWTSRSTDRLALAVPMRVAIDLVVDAPSRDALALEAHIAGLDLERGTTWSVSPRAGVEADVWPDRLRLRTGSYWEPGRNEGADGRLHVTGGYELRLFRFRALSGFIDEMLALEGGADVASRYSSIGFINLGMWRSGVTGGHAEGHYTPTEP